MSTASTKNTVSSLRRKLRARRDFRSFQRSYEQASPTMQAELLVMAQRQNRWV